MSKVNKHKPKFNIKFSLHLIYFITNVSYQITCHFILNNIPTQ